MRAGACALLALCALAGCGGSEKSRDTRPPSDARVIRAWLNAVNRGAYERAASYFAPGALVQQTEAYELPDMSAAIAFNRSLPCRADLTGVVDEGRTTLGSFRLRVGPAGTRRGCDSTVRVRFLIRGGRFTEWRQVPERPSRGGVTAWGAAGSRVRLG